MFRSLRFAAQKIGPIETKIRQKITEEFKPTYLAVINERNGFRKIRDFLNHFLKTESKCQKFGSDKLYLIILINEIGFLS